MLQGFEHILGLYLKDHSSAVAFIAEKSGRIRWHNEPALFLFGSGIKTSNVTGLLHSAGPLNLTELAADPDIRHMFKLKLDTEQPLSFYFHFYPAGDQILCIGEQDLAENQSLQQNYVELTRDLANLTRDIQRKNAELDRVNESKNEFMGVVAHDLRNPIGVIQSYCTYLKGHDNVTKECIEVLNKMNRSSEYMLTLLEDFLDLTQIEAGKIELHPIKSSINELLTECIEIEQVKAAEKNISLQLDLTEELPEIVLDYNKIEQVVYNLLSNAVKFSDPGTNVYVTASVDDEQLTVQVKDEGPGIAESQRENLFKAYKTAGTKSTAGEKSTGLGLAIVHNIVVAHLGRIWVDSELGQGSTFYFSLPRRGLLAAKKSKTINGQRALLHNSKRSYKLPRGRELNIVCADDDADMRALLALNLKSTGFNIRLVEDGSQAVSSVQEGATDLLIMDVEMPGLDGCSAIRQIRAAGEDKLPAIALTAHTRKEEKEAIIAAGFDLCLRKPVAKEDLIAAIESFSAEN